MNFSNPTHDNMRGPQRAQSNNRVYGNQRSTNPRSSDTSDRCSRQSDHRLPLHTGALEHGLLYAFDPPPPVLTLRFNNTKANVPTDNCTQFISIRSRWERTKAPVTG